MRQLCAGTTVMTAALLLGGCAVTMADCDPSRRDVGFGTKLGCQVHGVSDQRIQRLEFDLAEQKRLNANFRAVYEAVEKEKKEVRGELGRKRTEYGKLERAMNRLLDDLQQKAGGNQRLQAEIASLRGQLETVKSGDGQAVVAKQVQLDQLKGRVQQLEQELGL